MNGQPGKPTGTAAQGWIRPFSTACLGIYLAVRFVALAVILFALWPVPGTPINGERAWESTVRFFTSSGKPAKVGDEARLLLIVIVAGGLGSCVHAATSFVTYVGNRSLVTSWLWWYLLRPLIGMTLAVIFYFVVRGGLLSGGADADSVSLFGIAAVAGLVGMFSKQATDKLQELFDNLFQTEAGTGDDQRGDKLDVATSVLEEMIPLNKITSVDIPEGKSEKDVKVVDLYRKYGGVVTRVPVLDHRDFVRHVIHQGLVYKFISDSSVDAQKTGATLDIEALTLEQFLQSKDMAALVTESIAFVPKSASIGEAKTEMERLPKCQDVFVTEHGLRDEAVLGWLPNVEIGRLSKA
jgi:hypothetical protein